MGVMEPEPALGARGGRQGWWWWGGAGRLLPPAFVLGHKPMTEKEGVRVCVCVCVCVCVYVLTHSTRCMVERRPSSEPPMMSDSLTPHGTSSS